MIKVLWKSLLVSPALLGAVLAVASTATAAQTQSEAPANSSQQANLLAQAVPAQAPVAAPLSPLNQIEVYKSGYTSGSVPVIVINSSSQVTSVSQLSDVQPTDWAFQALQSLVERYGVIAGYPDGTFRGNRAMTRYEFAAGLNAALDRVNELIAAGTADLVTKEDLATLQRLQEEFASELATLRGRVDALEVRTSELEAQQFSTTTKLVGEVVFNIAGVISGQSNGTGVTGPVGGTSNQQPNDVARSTAFGERVRLNFDTSFSGRDRLRVRFEQVGLGRFQTLSGSTFNEGRLAFDGNSSNFNLGLLQYRFPLVSGMTAYIAAAGNSYDNFDFTPQLNPYFDDTGSGALSRFGQRAPIFRLASGAGAGVRWRFSDAVEVDLGYIGGGGSNSPANPVGGQGLFNGQYSALAQIVLNPSGAFRLGFTYANSYAPGALSAPGAVGSLTGTGSNAANTVTANGVVSDSYNIAASLRLSPALTLGGWVGYSNQRYIGLGDGDVWNWAATLAFPDLGGEGNLAGIIVGQEPRLTYTSTSGLATAVGLPTKNGQLQRANPDAGLHVEGFYRFQVTDNISITPGLIWLTSPNHDERNNDVVIGVLRTVFKF